ncbi:3-methyladenine DNA glycosylase [Haloferula sp.]|uniref:3-methyladenine DNA glycosylase n=1 Tax=Haloferula sp. TaxID=2497595 RepID=UPI003C7151FF
MNDELSIVVETLPQSEWLSRSGAHRRRAEQWTGPARRRRSSGVPHPIEDFLFTYYPFSFGKLETWHPPFGTALVGPIEENSPFSRAPYKSAKTLTSADPEKLSAKATARLVWIRELLHQTQNRTPVFSCHGLHEWAMVYRGCEVRHKASTPLRLSQQEIDRVVENRSIVCTHFDAFRFFHPEAQPLNRVQPSLNSRPEFEQPGCVHANMDLYKWASKAMPWIGSDLHIECFELAIRLRELDMRASPYDLECYDLKPIRIETSDGRHEYEIVQRQLAAEAAQRREKLIEILDRVLSAKDLTPGSCHLPNG